MFERSKKNDLHITGRTRFPDRYPRIIFSENPFIPVPKVTDKIKLGRFMKKGGK